MIKIEKTRKSFGKLEVLKGIDLHIEPGKTTAILGPNGSGKTTLIKSILGMVKPTSGDILFMEKSVLQSWSYRNHISYLPQIARFPENLAVNELIEFVKDLRGQQGDHRELADAFELNADMTKKLRHLSGGTRQKVNLILTFMFDNPVYILDEPTSGLDPVAMIRLKSILAEKKQVGKTILFTTHIINIVEEIADELVFLLEGEIYYSGSVFGLKKKQNEYDLENAIANILMNSHAESIKV